MNRINHFFYAAKWGESMIMLMNRKGLFLHFLYPKDTCKEIVQASLVSKIAPVYCRLLLPLITWQVVGALELQQPANVSRGLSMYGFLYGTFPTAPSVFLYASHFAVAQDIVCLNVFFI